MQRSKLVTWKIELRKSPNQGGRQKTTHKIRNIKAYRRPMDNIKQAN